MIHFETVSESYGKVGHDLEERTKTTSTRQPRHMARRILVRSMARQRRKSSKMTGKIRQELGDYFLFSHPLNLFLSMRSYRVRCSHNATLKITIHVNACVSFPHPVARCI
jgi:hypothetical protein